MLNDIKTKLEAISTKYEMEGVCYGVVPSNSNIKKWNYIVFNRDSINKTGTTKYNYTEFYTINIVCENVIPDDLVYETINKLSEIKGLKFSDRGITFNYTKKANTDLVVEIATFYMSDGRKVIQ